MCMKWCSMSVIRRYLCSSQRAKIRRCRYQVLARKWSQENSQTLLVGVKDGTNTLKKFLAVSHRVKCTFTIWQQIQFRNYDHIFLFYGTIEDSWSDELKYSLWLLKLIMTRFCFKSHVSCRINSQKSGCIQRPSTSVSCLFHYPSFSGPLHLILELYGNADPFPPKFFLLMHPHLCTLCHLSAMCCLTPPSWPQAGKFLIILQDPYWK